MVSGATVTTRILDLPQQDLGVQLTIETSQDSEWTDVFAWTVQQVNNGVTTLAALDITDIAFALNLRSVTSGKVVKALSTADGTLVNGGPSGQLAFNVPVAIMAGILPDTYAGNIRAVADGHTTVVGKATVIHSASD